MARKKVVPEYGTIMKRGVQYYRTRMQDADGKWISLYAQTPEELYDKSIEMKRSIEDEIFRKNNPTVAEYCEKWLKMRSASVRENTLSGYERTIRKYIIGAIGDMYMDEVTIPMTSLAAGANLQAISFPVQQNEYADQMCFLFSRRKQNHQL